MLGQHLIRRRSHYYYVCRVPHDLLHHFPKPVLWHSLKTSNLKHARLLASSWEFKTQQLFMQIRSGMLDSNFIDHLVHLYLEAGIKKLESEAYLQKHKAGEIETVLDREIDYKLSDLDGLDLDGLEGHPDLSSYRAELIRQRIEAQHYEVYYEYTKSLVDLAKKKYDVKLTAANKKELGMKVLHCEKQLNEIDSARQRGDFAPLQQLKEKIGQSKPYFDIRTIIDKYQEWYISAKPDIKPGTRSDMEVECASLLEIFGNISIDSFNSMDSITCLKKVLIKYPKNRIQRFGTSEKCHINSILATEKDYEVISRKTANEYIKRAKAIVNFAIKDDYLDKANKWENELFKVDIVGEAKRRAYDDIDIKRLVDALCTQDLWRYNPPKPERFWIVLIALFHGLRLANITDLNKSDICLTHADIWVFRVRFGKTKGTVKDYPIHDCLLLLGFLEWVEKLGRTRLFQDSSKQISTWWNRVDKDKERNAITGGFEYSYVTTDPTKCLYSLRHHYAGEVYNATDDYKATAEALGHSLSGKVTNGYIGKIRLLAHKELTDKLRFSVDLDKLEARAHELFKRD